MYIRFLAILVLAPSKAGVEGEVAQNATERSGPR